MEELERLPHPTKVERICRLSRWTAYFFRGTCREFLYIFNFFAQAVIVTQILQQGCGSLHFFNQDITTGRRQAYRLSRSISAFIILHYPCKLMPSLDMSNLLQKRHKLHKVVCFKKRLFFGRRKCPNFNDLSSATLQYTIFADQMVPQFHGIQDSGRCQEYADWACILALHHVELSLLVVVCT